MPMLMPKSNVDAECRMPMPTEFIIVIDDGACDYLALVVRMMIVLVGFDWLHAEFHLDKYVERK